MRYGKEEEEEEEQGDCFQQLLQNTSDAYLWSLPPVHSFNPVHLGPDPYGGLFNRRSQTVQLGYDGPTSSDQLRLISDALLGKVGQPGSAQAQLSAQELMDAKAIAASKSHSEAERRRRERINNHLAKLRSLLPSTTKTDKASLLAEVIHYVKELKRQTSLIAETSLVPTELDELTVADASNEDGKFVIKASLSCEDRSDLLPDLIRTLKALGLKTLRAEITTLGGRMRNVLFITGDEDQQQQQQQQCSVSSIQEALKGVMGKVSGDHEASSGGVKRQRIHVNVLEHRSI
ncbi:transcription factor bHLH30-like [Actinidia eriantha]|uniref:transcription factor bHLH30-like n=1 Tax=Actinidia eriantha TaxID=165200 RepID=UPI00258DCACD|nr:transcription factor bHLH30-like [Actinidia eriantha]